MTVEDYIGSIYSKVRVWHGLALFFQVLTFGLVLLILLLELGYFPSLHGEAEIAPVAGIDGDFEKKIDDLSSSISSLNTNIGDYAKSLDSLIFEQSSTNSKLDDILDKIEEIDDDINEIDLDEADLERLASCDHEYAEFNSDTLVIRRPISDEGLEFFQIKGSDIRKLFDNRDTGLEGYEIDNSMTYYVPTKSSFTSICGYYGQGIEDNEKNAWAISGGLARLPYATSIGIARPEDIKDSEDTRICGVTSDNGKDLVFHVWTATEDEGSVLPKGLYLEFLE